MTGSFDHRGEMSRRGGADVAAAIHRAHRAIRFYPASHPSTVEALEQLSDVLRRATGDGPAITLDVREHAFAENDVVIFGGDDPRGAIAHAMYLDGVRSITFHPGVAEPETTTFVEILARSDDSDRLDHDMATLLWELDLPHITLTIADPLLDEHAWEGKGGMIQQVRGELAEIAARSPLDELGSPVEPVLSPSAQEAYIRLLSGAPATPEEVERLIAAEERDADILAQFLEVLIEVLGQAQTEAEIASVSHSVSDVLESYLDWGRFSAVTSSVDRLRRLVRQRPELGSAVDAILSALTAPETLREIVFGLDTTRPDGRADLEDMLYTVRESAYPTMIALLTEAEGRSARKCLLNVCTRGEGTPAEFVTPYLEDPRWYVVRNMVYLLGSMGDREALTYIERTLSHPDERVRRESVRALQSIGGERAAELLMARLQDEASSVRVLAARGLPGMRREEAASVLLDQIASRSFADRGTSEIEAFFDVVAEVADDDDIETLSGLWSSHSRLRSRSNAVRLGALRVVAGMGSEAAREALQHAAGSSDEDVRKQARFFLGAGR
jgi:hypothetical protein